MRRHCLTAHKGWLLFLDFLFLVLGCSFTSIAQPYPEDLYFSSIDQPFPRSFARTYEDSQGFLWFCTGGGLCRYDGSEVRLYKADINEANALSSSHIRDITEDQQGRLWITTNRGLNAFEPTTSNFQTYFTDVQDTTTIPGNWPKYITTDTDGLLWIGFNESAGLACFDPESGNSKRFPIRKGQLGQLQGSVIGRLVADDERIYMGTTAGFEYYDKASKRFHFLPLLDEQGDTMYYRLNTLCKSQDGKIWMNMPGKGLSVYDPEKDRIDVFRPSVLNGGSLSSVKDIVEGKDGRLWLLNWPNLWSVSPDRKVVQKHKIKFIDHNPERGHEEFYENLHIDRYGLLWIGPHYYDPRGELFEHHQIFKAKNSNPLFITNIQEVNDSLVIVFIRGGFRWYNTRTRTIQPFTIPSPLLMGESGFQPCASNWVWFVIDGVIYFYNMLDRKVYKLALEKNGSPLRINFMEFDFDKEENIWISTWGQGLIRVPKKSWSNAMGPIREFDQWLSHSPAPTVPASTLLGVTIDSRNDVWVTSNVGGLTRINADNMNFQHFNYKKGANTVSDNYTFKVAEGQYNAIWITTNASGLNKYDPENDQFTIYNRKKGMLDEDLSNIGVDRDGHLWMNTDAGLTAFDPLTETFVNYDERDGLLSWRSNGIVSEKTNRLLWGGRQGFTIAQIDSLKNRPVYSSELVLTNVRIYDPDSSALISQQPIRWADYTLDLSYRQNVLDIQCSVLDFRNPIKHHYRYALTRGGEPEWVDLGTQNQINLSQLVPGTYYLYIEGCNSDQIWTALKKPLQIIIRPPFWKTTWAYIGYLLLLASGIYTWYRSSLRRQLARQETQKIIEVNALKARLYTNITHEFRTPLTVIMGVSDELEINSEQLPVSEVVKQKIKQGHSLIYRNSKNLLRLINQLLDLAKLESGNMDLQMVHADVVHLLRYLTESFSSMAVEKNLKLTFYSEVRELKMDFDEIKMQHIVYNLLSNAIKFTHEGGTVDLLVSQIQKEEREYLQIKVQDNGIGISEQQLPFLFDRFYQVDSSATRKAEGTGIGLAFTKELVDLMQGDINVQSRRSIGSVFTVKLPLGNVGAPIAKTTTNLLANQQATQLTTEAKTIDIPTEVFVDGQERPLLLVIEDNNDVVSYLKIILQKEYQVEVADNGQEGIDQALKTIPDIIITDVMMPEKDGYEVCEILKTDERTSHIPIIMLTAKATEADRLVGLRTGADAYLMKPFNKQELFVRLEKLLELRRVLQQRYTNTAGSFGVFGVPKSNISKTPSIDDLFLEKICQVIDEKIGDTDLNLDYLCKVAHLSSTQLFRKMKALTGQPPMSFVRKVRLHKAKALLQTTDLNISEIAYDLGFTDPQYFSRAFSKEFNYPPSYLRK